jgi:hypothetical protein
MYVWYCPSPAHWIWAEIIDEMFGRVTARTWDGQDVSGLVKRRVADAVILKRKDEKNGY